MFEGSKFTFIYLGKVPDELKSLDENIQVNEFSIAEGLPELPMGYSEADKRAQVSCSAIVVDPASPDAINLEHIKNHFLKRGFRNPPVVVLEDKNRGIQVIDHLIEEIDKRLDPCTTGDRLNILVCGEENELREKTIDALSCNFNVAARKNVSDTHDYHVLVSCKGTGLSSEIPSIAVVQDIRYDDIESMLSAGAHDIVVADDADGSLGFFKKNLETSVIDSLLNSPRSVQSSRKKVLVSDENTSQSRLIADVLHKGAHDVDYRRLRRNESLDSYDAVYIYAHMKGVQKIQETAFMKGIPVIAYTDRLKMQGNRNHHKYVDILLEKPIDASTIVNSLYITTESDYTLKTRFRSLTNNDGCNYYMLLGSWGVGKDTVMRKTLDIFPSVEKWVRATSRVKRGTEKQGFDYRFVRKDFLKLVKQKIIEDYYRWGEHYYSLDRLIANGLDAMDSMSIEGVRKYLHGDQFSSFIFVAASEERLMKRTENRPYQERSRRDMFDIFKEQTKELLEPYRMDLFLLNDSQNDGYLDKPIQEDFQNMKRCIYKLGLYIEHLHRP